MIFRISQKLGDKIKTNPEVVLPEHDNPFADWSAHLFTVSRIQYIIVSNTKTLYSIIMYAKGINDTAKFVANGITAIKDTLKSDGFEFQYKRFVEPDITSVTFSKNSNRRVIGSMNEMIYFAKVIFPEEKSITPYEATKEINGLILSILKYNTPREEFSAMRIIS
jgi:hypothetical protein